MDFWTIILLVPLALVVIPVFTYITVKFGAAGFYQARRRFRDKERKEQHGSRET